MRSRLRLTNSDGAEVTPDGTSGNDPGNDAVSTPSPIPPMRHTSHLSLTPSVPPPAPLSFAEAHQAKQLGFPFCRPDVLCDEVLRSLDALSTTLEDLRNEIDELEHDGGPSSAA